MSGFCRIILQGEYFSQAIVNTFAYRSEDWLPGGGNPFDDATAFVEAFLSHCKTPFLQCLNQDYTLLRAQGIGYDDSLNIVTASPVVITVNEHGTSSNPGTTGAIITAPLHFRLGEQVQITGIEKSKRNRGYIALGPMLEADCDDYGHLSDTFVNGPLTTLAGVLDDNLIVLTPVAATLIPIRFHEHKVLGVVDGRTYSDIKGYTLPRRFGTRKSRMAEA
jgi:hypothetical protein